MKRVFRSSIFMLIFSACGIFNPTLPTETPRPTHEFAPLATFTPVCISAEPTQQDIDRALSFTGNVLDTTEWDRSYTVESNRVAVTWLNDTRNSVAYLEALIFPCGYEEPDVDQYFNDENWKTIFHNYESYAARAICKTNAGLRLYEFSARDQGNEYEIRFWAQNDTDHRVLTVMLVFPTSRAVLVDTYALRLFPKLMNCR
jgi:hypothetical protein